MNTYVQGSSVRMTTQVNAQVTPPTVPPTVGPLIDATVSAKITDPAGVVTVLTVVRDSLGTYHADFVTVLLGLHTYEFLCTGAAVVNGVGQFIVNAAVF